MTSSYRRPVRSVQTSTEYRAQVRSVECPSCAAQPGELCINAVTHRPMLASTPGHIARAFAAREQQQ